LLFNCISIFPLFPCASASARGQLLLGYPSFPCLYGCRGLLMPITYARKPGFVDTVLRSRSSVYALPAPFLLYLHFSLAAALAQCLWITRLKHLQGDELEGHLTSPVPLPSETQRREGHWGKVLETPLRLCVTMGWGMGASGLERKSNCRQNAKSLSSNCHRVHRIWELQ